jgi:hypothetical protein
MPAEIYRRIFLFMARPQRNSVDYFPFLCKEGTTMYYIEQKYGNDGFATWIKLLRQLAVTDYHYLNLSSKPQVMFLSAKCKVSEETLLLIIQDLCDMGEFEAFLWEESRVIFSTKFVAHVQDAYAKRNNKCIDLPGLLLLLEGLGVRKPHKELGKLPLKGPVNPQRKEEYSKEDIIHIGTDTGISIAIKPVYANDRPIRIYDLQEYFAQRAQAESLSMKGWVHYRAFLEANPGRVFNDPDHVYNSFRQFCEAYKPPPAEPKKYEEAAYNRTLWTVEAWEKAYDWQLKGNNDFRKHFGYEELSNGGPMGKHNNGRASVKGASSS